jgi:hypothetical protein
MRAPSTLINDLLWRDGQQRAIDAPYRHPRYWIWLGIIGFNIAFWTGVGYGTRTLIAAL